MYYVLLIYYDLNVIFNGIYFFYLRSTSVTPYILAFDNYNFLPLQKNYLVKSGNTNIYTFVQGKYDFK